MAELNGLRPWWERRWKKWWDEQRLMLDARCPGGTFGFDDARHVASWYGLLPLRDGRALGLGIGWGPGTPFMWPRLHPQGIKSIGHMFCDGSMCLASPASPEGGWTGFVDIGVWLDRAQDWFEAVEASETLMAPLPFQFLAHFLPQPGYRRFGTSSIWLALPPQWDQGPPAQLGHFKAVLPASDTGLGAIVWWRAGKKVGQWDVGKSLVGDGGRCVDGIWAFGAAQIALEQMRQGGPQEGVPPIDRATRRELLRLEEKLSGSLRSEDETFIELIGYTPTLFLGQPRSTWRWRYSRGQKGVDALTAKLPPPFTTPEVPIDDFVTAMQQTIKVMANRAGETARRGQYYPTCRVDERVLSLRRTKAPRAGGPMNPEDASIAIVGLGALGSEVAHLMAREGIGRFVLLDPDVLEPGNISRHRGDLSQVGRAKVEVVQELIHRANPGAMVEGIQNWLDEVLPSETLSPLAGVSLVLGLTAEEGIEGLLDELCDEWSIPALHGWLELEGQVLRLFRVVPGEDPSLLELMTSPEGTIPSLPRGASPGDAAECADLILPGSQLNIHAAANFIAQEAMRVLRGQRSPENHWLFAPGGLSEREVIERMPALGRPYGAWAGALDPKSGGPIDVGR